MKRIAVVLVLVLVAAAVGMQVLMASSRDVSPAPIVHTALTYGTASDRSLHCTRLAAPPEIDGDLTDWPAGESINLNRDTAYSFSGRVTGTDDVLAIVRSGWDQDNLYFAIHVIDDILVTDSTDVWRDDGVEIGIDGLRDWYAWGFDDHQYSVVADGRTTDRALPTTDISTAVLTYEGGYDIEMAIPMSQLLPGTPISGTVMGFTVGLHDDDDGGNWDAYLIWEGTNTSSTPEEYASLLFADRPEDRLAELEAKLERLEQQVQQLLIILRQFEQLTPP